LSEIAQGFHDNEKKVARQKTKLATEEEWLKELEADPAIQDIDVRKELGKCQFWCKQRNYTCTRKRFSNWLLNPACERKIVRSYDGATSKPAKPQPPKPRYTLETPVPGWPMILRNYLDLPTDQADALCSYDWHELSVSVREKIIRAA